MSEEKSILDATEYVLVALNNIKSFDDFNDYKEEIEKAVYDIRNSITNIINLKKNKKPNLNISDNTSNKTSISSMLGLKFNYDAYLNDFNINNINQNDLNIKNDNYNNNLINNNFSEKNTNINNEEYNEENIINKQNNIGIISFKDENTNFENNMNNEDNIIYNKSIRNKFKKSKNINNIKSINNNKIKDFNNKDININTKKNEKLTDLDKNISENTNSNKNKSSPLNYRKEKLSLIADIIMKINSEDYFYEILTKLFGNDLTDKLMSSDVSDELLEAVQNSIKEIEELKNKDNLNSEQNEKNENINQEELEEEPRKFPSNEIMTPPITKDKTIIKNNKEIKSNKYQEFDFQKNLRKNENSEGKKIKGKNINNSIKKEKPFISATSVYGNYFDPSLQKGGISKLDDYKK